MNVLRIFLSAVAGLCGLAALGGLALAFGGHWIVGLPLIVVGSPLAYMIWNQGQRYTIQASTEQQGQFEETARLLASQNNGVVPITALMKATGLERERVEQMARALIAKGVCELDFADTGEMQYRLTPTDEARAQLAAVKDRA